MRSGSKWKWRGVGRVPGTISCMSPRRFLPVSLWLFFQERVHFLKLLLYCPLTFMTSAAAQVLSLFTQAPAAVSLPVSRPVCRERDWVFSLGFCCLLRHFLSLPIFFLWFCSFIPHTQDSAKGSLSVHRRERGERDQSSVHAETRQTREKENI